MRAFIASLAMALAACTNTGTSAPATSAATVSPESVVDRFHAALRSGDGETALALLADDVLILEGGRAERSKSEYAAHHLATDMAFTRAVPTTVTQRSVKAVDGMAFVATEGRTTGSYRGRAIDKINAESIVLRRIGNGWTIVHIHWSSADPR